MTQPTLEEMIALIDQRDKDSRAMEAMAAQQVTGQPTGGGFSTLTGRGADDATRRQMMQTYSSILNRKPGQTGIGAASEGFEKGKALMDDIRTKEKATRMSAAQMGIDRQTANLTSQAAMYGLGEAADTKAYNERRDLVSDQIARTALERKTMVEDRAFNKPATPNYGFQNVDVQQPDGSWEAEMAVQDPRTGRMTDRNGADIVGNVRESMTGRTADDTASGLKPPSPANLQKTLNAKKAEGAYEQLEDMLLDQPRMDQLSTLVQGGLGLPTPVGRAFQQAGDVITNALGRLESGGQIREDEGKKYGRMLVPTILDIGAPDVIRKKIRDGKVFNRVFYQIQAGQMSVEDGLAEIDASIDSPLGAENSNAPKAPEVRTAGGAIVTRD